MDNEQDDILIEESITNEDECLTDVVGVSSTEGEVRHSDSDEHKWQKLIPENVASVVVSWTLVVSVLLCVGVLAQVLSKGYVSIAGYSLFRVVTGSMEPEVPVGSLLVSKSVDIDEIQVGDIINFRAQESGMLGMVITHRVIQRYEDEEGNILLETKGDANRYADGYLVEDVNLIGKTVSYTKDGNLIAGILSLLTNKIGFLACIVVPCLMIGVLTMRDCIKNLRDEIEEVSRQLNEKTQEEGIRDPANSLEQQLSEAEYQELCARLRNELMEELKQGEEKQTTEKPGKDDQ